MSWAGIANNQTVTFNNLQDAVNTGVFTAKAAIPVSQKCITKTDANDYVNINTSKDTYAAKAPNQLVYKADLVASSPTNTIIYVPSSGLYPLSGESFTSTSGVITNYFNVQMWVYCVFNSAGLSSGTVYNDYMTIIPLSSKEINGQSFIGTGQTLFSAPYTLEPNTSYDIILNKGDLLGGGSTLRFYGGNIYGGDIFPI